MVCGPCYESKSVVMGAELTIDCYPPGQLPMIRLHFVYESTRNTFCLWSPNLELPTLCKTQFA